MIAGLKKGVLVICVGILCFATMGMVVAKESPKYDGEITVSIEVQTLGWKQILPPKTLLLDAGDTIPSVFQKAVGDGLILTWEETTFQNLEDGSTQQGERLVSIGGIAGQALAIPEEILSAFGKTLIEPQDTTQLSAGDVVSTSQWLVDHNGVVTNGIGSKTLQSGDVVRLHFSLTGDGVDLVENSKGNPLPLIQLLGELSAVEKKTDEMILAMDLALLDLQRIDLSQGEIDAHVTTLSQLLKEEELPQEQTSENKEEDNQFFSFVRVFFPFIDQVGTMEIAEEVKEEIIPVEYVELDKDEGVFDPRIESPVSLNLNARIGPWDANEQYEVIWTSDKQEIAVVQQNEKNPLNAKVTVTPNTSPIVIPKDDPVANVSVAVVGKDGRIIDQAIFKIFRGMTVTAIQQMVDNLPEKETLGDVSSYNQLIQTTYAFGLLSEVDQKQIKDGKLLDLQKSAGEMNHATMFESAPNGEKTAYLKRIRLVDGNVLPWYVRLEAKEVTEGVMTSLVSATEGSTLEQVTELDFVDTLNGNQPYKVADFVQLMMEVPETNELTLAKVEMQEVSFDTEYKPVFTKMDSTLSLDRHSVYISTKGGIVAYRTLSKKTSLSNGASANGSGIKKTSSLKIPTTKMVQKEGLKIGESGIGMVDITENGQLRATQNTKNSWTSQLWSMVKPNLLPFGFGAATMAILWGIGLGLYSKTKGKQ